MGALSNLHKDVMHKKPFKRAVEAFQCWDEASRCDWVLAQMFYLFKHTLLMALRRLAINC